MKIFKCAEKHPERVLAVTDDGEEIRYQELLDTARQCFSGLGHNLAFLLCDYTPGSLLSYLGALYADMVPLLLDAHLRPELLQSLLETYRPAYCAMPEALLMPVSELLPQTYAVQARIRSSVLIRTGWEGPELSQELKLLLTTSGSTGSPKLVRISAENLDSNTESIAEYLKIDAAERPITTLPMFYSYGMSILNSHVYRGATILLTSYTILENRFWERLAEEKATSIAGVPYTYEMLDRLKLTEMDLPSLKTLTQAGGKLPETLHRRFASWCLDTGRNFCVMYGQTEASPRMGYLPPHFSLNKCGSMGIAIPGGTLYLEDDAGIKIEQAGRTGELIYRGANVSLGYAQCREDLGKGDENCGVLRTGDMAYCDEEGFFYIVGRKKRFIKILGTRYGLDELERSLKQEIHLRGVACVGQDDCLCVFVEEESEFRLCELTNYLIDSLSIPEKCIVLREISRIPVTASGKTDYAALMNLEKGSDSIDTKLRGG